MRRAVMVLGIVCVSGLTVWAGEYPFTEERWIQDVDGQWRDGVQWVDLDQDGDLDILIAGHKSLRWLQNKKRGAKLVEREIDSRTTVTAFAVGDIDGDGDLDVVGAGHERQAGVVRWWENAGKARVFERRAIDLQGAAGLIRLGDLDGDGDLDVVLRSSKSLRWYENTGKGRGWAKPRTISTKIPYNAPVALMDYDGDKDLDVVTRTAGAFVWFANTGRAWTRNVISTNGKHLPTSLQAIDFDGDGDPDLVVGARKSVSVYVNYGKGRFSCEEILDSKNVIKEFWAIAGDVNRDGKLDVIVAHPRKLVWYEREDDDWTAHLIGKTHDFPEYFAVGDLDGDGDADVLLNKNRQYRLLLWQNESGPAAKK